MTLGRRHAVLDDLFDYVIFLQCHVWT